MKNRIFSIDNPKAAKANEYGWLNAIHYMAPHTLAGVGNLCAHASPSCIEICLGKTSGAAVYYSSVLQSRIEKAQRFMRDRANYMRDMIKAIHSAQKKAHKLALKLCVRPNGSTDIPFEAIKAKDKMTLPELFPDIQFTDYTKNKKRVLRMLRDISWPVNYHLTFSLSETNQADAIEVLQAGGNVAAVFGNGLPATYLGFPVIDGDKHDLRHLDPRGVIVGLSPKGHIAKRDRSGFVLREYMH